MVRVPKVGNSSIGAVGPRLYRAGLRIAIPNAWTTASNDGLGALIERPGPGRLVGRGTTVTLRIENIPGWPTWSPGHYVVPNVVGKDLNAATRSIEFAGLPWDVRASSLPPTVTSDLFASYCVTSQHPGAGTEQDVASSGPRPAGVALTARPC